MTVQYKLYCRDAADLTVPCNGAENHAHVRPTYAGSLTAADASLDGIQRTASWIVRDLGLPAARVGGAGTDTFASHLATGDYTLTVTDTLKNALFAPAAPAVPSGGTLDLAVTVERTRTTTTPADRSFAVAAHLAFTGPDAGTLTLDGTQSYAVTVSSGAVTKQ